MHIVTPIADCSNCGAQLGPAHKVKSIVVPDNPPYIAVVLKCALCGRNTKVLTDKDRWHEAEKEHAMHVVEHQSLMAEWHEAWEELTGIEELLEVWSKSAPLLEDRRGRCGCKQCRAKWYKE